MSDAVHIEKHPELEVSQDYALLRSEGVERVADLAHAKWTDYNVHDPGISILELVCYAITDLGFRTGYDVADLLTRSERGRTFTAGSFHTAAEILTSKPITFTDLRKLLIDVRGVRNAWIERHDEVVYCVDSENEQLVDCPAAPLATGITENAPLNGLFDVFVEYETFVEEEPRLVHVGPPDREGVSGRYINTSDRGILFLVEYPLRLEAVSVYAESAGPIRIRLVNADGRVVHSVNDNVTDADTKTRIPLGFELAPGRYRVDALGTGVKLFRHRDPDFPYRLDDVIHLVTGVRGGSGRHRHPYYFFYDWEVGYAVPSSPGRVESVRTHRFDTTGMLDHTEGRGRFIEARRRGLLFSVENEIELEAVSVVAESDDDVTVRLVDSVGTVLTVVTAAATAGDVTRVPLNVTVPPGEDYRLDAVGTSVKLYAGRDPAFPYRIDEILELISGVDGTTLRHSYYFFYSWEVSYSWPPETSEIPAGFVPNGLATSTITGDDVRLAVRDRLFAYRNLCEDVASICELSFEEVAVCSEVVLSPGAHVEEVLAEIFYRLGAHISPPVRFYTIDELLEKGRRVDEIFEGPLLDHGFIDDEEFRQIERRCEIRGSDVIRIIMEVDGVAAVKSLSLLSFVDDALRAEADWLLELASDRSLAPSFSPDKSKFIFFKNGLPYYPNKDRVDDLLAENRAHDLQTKLRGHEQDLDLPAGTYREVDAYFPFQNDLPALYLVGRHRVPDSYTPLRKAQARQLKAYLLFFEQILANAFAQLAHLPELFSWRGEVDDPTYFTQAVEDIADVCDVYVPCERLPRRLRQAVLADFGSCPQLNGHTDAPPKWIVSVLRAIIEQNADARERRLRALEHLAARYAEDLTAYKQLTTGSTTAEVPARIVRDLQLFLADYPRVSSCRGQAYDYRFPDRSSNLSGYQRRVYRLLGIRDVTQRRLAGERFRIVSSGLGEDRRWRFLLEDETGATVFESRACESKDAIEVLLDAALQLASESDAFREDASGTVRLVRPCDDEDEEVGHVTSSDEDVVEYVKAYFARIGRAEGFRLVEHILLRKRTAGDPFLPIEMLTEEEECSCVEVREPYSFRISIVLPSWPVRFRDVKFRTLVEETLRKEAPAHVFARICWVNHVQMHAFEAAHETWQRELAGLESHFGRCKTDARTTDDAERPFYGLSGKLPLPQDVLEDRPEAAEKHQAYRSALETLIDQLYALDNVYPLARLHDCEGSDGDQPVVTLDRSTLGTF